VALWATVTKIEPTRRIPAMRLGLRVSVSKGRRTGGPVPAALRESEEEHEKPNSSTLSPLSPSHANCLLRISPVREGSVSRLISHPPLSRLSCPRGFGITSSKEHCNKLSDGRNR
jgi:hypothetical protein